MNKICHAQFGCRKKINGINAHRSPLFHRNCRIASDYLVILLRALKRRSFCEFDTLKSIEVRIKLSL